MGKSQKLLSRKPYRLQGISAGLITKNFCYADLRSGRAVDAFGITFCICNISMGMNPYEIVKDPVIERPGMSVPAYLILVLSLALFFVLI